MSETHLVRLCCASCGHRRVGSIDFANGEVRIRAHGRRKMLGTNRTEADRWEYGTASTPPRTGEPPSGARIFTERYDRSLSYPDHPELSGPPFGAGDWGGPEVLVRCSRCTETLTIQMESVGDALTTYDRTGRPVDLILEPVATE